MSARYEILKALVRASGLKKRWGMSTEELLDNRRKANAKNRIPELHDPEFEIDRINVCGCPVVTMKHKGGAQKANLFIIGGGMISAPRPASIKKALRFAKETGLDLYVPYYPLCTDWPLTKAYEMIHATYLEMLRGYTPGNVSVLGTSSGGNLALGMVPYINESAPDTPMPGYIMAISPGTCVETEEEWQRMLELDQKDVAIPASYMKSAVDIMKHGDDSVPDYMIWLQKGNFSNCPRVTFIYGSDETLFACAPSFEAAMQNYGADYELIVGEGMFHCYPVFPVCREAREGWELMVRKVKENTAL
ncbi:MAG: alpha/beta hydrolase [Oscillospiraceae bacterium]|nr:alpha/beta hydrolase [Oscillospiraceae bacterium]